MATNPVTVYKAFQVLVYLSILTSWGEGGGTTGCSYDLLFHKELKVRPKQNFSQCLLSSSILSKSTLDLFNFCQILPQFFV